MLRFFGMFTSTVIVLVVTVTLSSSVIEVVHARSNPPSRQGQGQGPPPLPPPPPPQRPPTPPLPVESSSSEFLGERPEESLTESASSTSQWNQQRDEERPSSMDGSRRRNDDNFHRYPYTDHNNNINNDNRSYEPRRNSSVNGNDSANDSRNNQREGLPPMPIHYKFSAKRRNDDVYDDDHDDPLLDGDNVRDDSINVDIEKNIDNNYNNKMDDRRLPQRASPRQDIVTRYMTTTSGTLQVHTTAIIVGASTGIACAKSFLPFGEMLWAGVLSIIFGMSSIFARTPWGELVRAVALSFLLVGQRTRSIRRQYPTWGHLAASIVRLNNRGRRPFPPARSPWKYQPRYRDDPEFNMMYCIGAMILVGSTCGGNIRLPMFPTWIGSLAGATSFGLACTLTDSPRGDLARTIGMRVVVMVQTLWNIQAQLKIVPKAAEVSSQVIDKLMILDRQHKVKDKFLKVVNAGYDQVMKTSERGQIDENRQQRPSRNIRDREFNRRDPSFDNKPDNDSYRQEERRRDFDEIRQDEGSRYRRRVGDMDSSDIKNDDDDIDRSRNEYEKDIKYPSVGENSNRFSPKQESKKKRWFRR